MEKKWVSIWGNALSRPEENPERYARDLTLRYVITPSMDGEMIRLTFSNFDGYEEAVISTVTVAKTDSGSNRNVRKDSVSNVTFDGKRELHLVPGEIRKSDALYFPVRRGEQISVSFYLNGYTDMGSGVSTSGPLTIGYFARGRYSDKLIFPAEVSKPIATFYFLNTVDVLTNSQNKAIMVFGDSITQQSWPEHLTKRILRDDIEHIAIVRRAIGGNRVLREYTHLENVHYGRRGIDRFLHDLELTEGVSGVIVLHGVNDLIHPEAGNFFRSPSDLPTAEELINGLREYVRISKEHGLWIKIGTITPFGKWCSYTDEKEQLRQQVNAWIRSNTEADGYMDFSELLTDPKENRCLLPVYALNDGLHPSLAGAEHMAESIPVEWLV